MSRIANYLVQLHLIYFGVIICWEYKNQGSWGEEFPQCSGNRQSPILINTAKTMKEYFPAVEFVGYHNLIGGNSFFRNDGKTVLLQLGESEEKPYIFGGKLPGIFEFESFHFHWGLTSDRGSEHHVNKEQYSMEMHFVHKNRKYSTFQEAAGFPDGIAVVGVFLDEDENDNYELTTLIQHVAQLKRYNSTINVQSPIVLSFYLPFDIDNFFTYEGSLTTPPCSEAVTWVVYPETVPISNRQLNVFRNLQKENGQQLVNNFRKLQPVNGRPVYERVLDVQGALNRNQHKNYNNRY